MITDYLSSFMVGVDRNPMSIINIASDETEKVKQYLKGEITQDQLTATTRHYTPTSGTYEGIRAQLTTQYSNYHVSIIETYGYGIGYPLGLYIASDNYIYERIPFSEVDSYIVVITSVPLDDIVSNVTLLDSETLVAYGVTFMIGTAPEPIYPEPTEPIEPPDNPNDITSYVESITANNGQIDLLNSMSDDTQIFFNVFVDEIYEGVEYPTATHYLQSEIQGIDFTLKEEYQDLNVFVLRLAGNGNGWSHMDFYPYSEHLQDLYEWYEEINEIPVNGTTTDGIIFLVCNANILEMEEPYEIRNAVVKGWGITFKLGEQPEEGEEPDVDLPPEQIDPEELNNNIQFIEVLDGTTLEHYSYVPDVYNVQISQAINGYYTLNFNLQPYVNASNIYTPRIVFCDNEYFHVQQITKRNHLNSLEMDVYCEHVSYELNYPHASFWDEIKEDYVWTEDTYRGTASQILWELLQYNNRFSVGTVDNDVTEHTFKTSTEGFRSRINEFAEQIGLEVRWNKFTVSLLRKRGRDHGLTFEIGKNIVGLTEIITTTKLGKVERSYELDVLDLNYVYDANDAPLELHNITLGDAVTIINPNYLIQRKDRIVSISRDPFQKALPTIEFSNKVASFTSDSGKGGTKASAETPGTPVTLPIYQENITRGQKGNAFGEHTQATADWTFAEGYHTKAFGERSHAEGSVTLASGVASHSEGNSTQATGDSSHAQGVSTIASGYGSHSEGGMTRATGDFSNASGHGSIASGYASRATGSSTQATANFSNAEGSNSVASGDYSHAFGTGTVADKGNGIAIGKYNKPFFSTDNSSWSTWPITDVFVIGNGDSDITRSNAFKINYMGQVYAEGTYNTTGADYSEFFEWVDGNPNNEERRGYIVTFEGDKIRLASSADEYILGIISSNPGVIGNSYENQWNGMYITDEWGNVEYHYTDIPYNEIDEEGNMITVYRQSYVPVINPNYNPNQTYTPRSQRSEWATVGMFGKLLVRDDGTCQINKYAKMNETVAGILSHSDTPTQFFVLRRINNELVEVLIK